MADLGNKYECVECGCKFYDLGKADAVCPKCGTDPREAEAPTKAPKPPAKAAPKTAAAKPKKSKAAKKPEAAEGDGAPDAGAG